MGPVREQILERALAGAGVPRASKARTLRLGARLAVPLMAAAAIAGLFLTRSLGDGWRAKGGPRGLPVLSIECSHGTLEHCSSSGMLLFRVEALRARSHLYAYAEPLGPGERIWFFTPDGSEPIVEPKPSPQVLSQGFQARSLGPGRYRVHLLASDAPLSKAELLSGKLPEQTLELTVLP